MKTHSIEYYRGRLRVDRHHLDDELEEHAMLYEQIGQAMSLAASAALKAKDRLAKVEGRVAENLKADDPSLSVPRLEAKVRRAEARLEAFDQWMQARERHEEWVALYEAWKTRGFSIRNLSDLYNSQYFALTSTSAHAGDSRRAYEERRVRHAEERQTNPRRRVVE